MGLAGEQRLAEASYIIIPHQAQLIDSAILALMLLAVGEDASRSHRWGPDAFVKHDFFYWRST